MTSSQMRISARSLRARLRRPLAACSRPASLSLPLASPAPAAAARAFASNHHGAHHRQPTSRVSFQQDYYALLEVHRHKLEEGELKAAYYRLAKQYHPDKLVHLPAADRLVAEQKFATVGVAYGVLSDPVKRQQYDIFLDLSAIGDQERMLHWMNIHRPPEKLGEAPRHGSNSAQQQQQQQADGASTVQETQQQRTTPAKPKVVLPFFRSS